MEVAHTGTDALIDLEATIRRTHVYGWWLVWVLGTEDQFTVVGTTVE
mgnify:CR=1 FL=1